jgi:putative restriction endonuclease
MRFWWVNQNQTYRQEIGGGYLWSPKRNANGAKNPFYEFMREAAPGDLVFSFVDTRIAAIGIVDSYCYESPKPAEFGSTGMNWEKIGWRVRVDFTPLTHKIRPKDHIKLLAPTFPIRYSPLQNSGDGKQAVYLAAVPELMAHVLVGLIGAEAEKLAAQAAAVLPLANARPETTDLEVWEHHIEQSLELTADLTATDRETLIVARRGQGLYKQRVMQVETHCRITLVDNPAHLRASHCKPWRDSNNAERLDGENGLLLTPTIDHLFDRGFISFEDSGRLIVSPVAHPPSLNRMGVQTDHPVHVGSFTTGQRQYLAYHRHSVFLQAAR